MLAKRINQLIALIAIAITSYYLVYRALYTFPSEYLWFAILFFVAELHGIFVFFLFCFETWDPQHPDPIPPEEGLNVDIYICTYNEEPELLRKTILGTEAIAYPHKTYVCDDGRREAIRELAEELDVEYITRPDNQHAKAGNINHALTKTSGDFIAILDADHVPLPDFLDRTMGYFSNPQVAFVQSPQTFYNLDAPEEFVDFDKGRQWDEAEVFFHLILPGKNRWNSAYFCGTGGIIRRQPLEQIGGFATETITEDIHTALRMHQLGYQSVYVAEHLASGQAAGDLPAYHVQRTRWALGNLRVMFCSNPLTAPGLTLPQRLSYLSSMFHWTVGLRKLILYSAPLMLLLLNAYPIAEFTGFLLSLYFLQLFAQIAVFKFITRGRGRILADEIFAMLNFWIFSSAFIRACFKLGAQKFEVTDKSGEAQFSIVSIRPHLLFLSITLVALTWGGLRLYYGLDAGPLGIGIAAFWSLWNAFFALKVILMATIPAREHEDIRFVDHIPVLYRLPIKSDCPERLAITTEYGEEGMTIITYEPLEIGQILDATLVLRFFRIQLQMEVLLERRLQGKNNTIYGYGVRFVNLDDAYRDMLNTHTMLYTTPRLLDDLGERGKKMLRQDSLKWLLDRNSRTRRIDFPINLDPDHNAWVHSRVENIDPGGAQLLVETPVETNGDLEFLMATPLGPVRGTLRAIDNIQELFHSSPVWKCNVEFDTLDEASKEIIKELTCDQK